MQKYHILYTETDPNGQIIAKGVNIEAPNFTEAGKVADALNKKIIYICKLENSKS